VQHFVADTASQYGHIQVGPAEVYLRTTTPELLQEVLHIRRVGQLLRPISDTVALLTSKDQPVVVEALRAGGYLPHLVDSIPRRISEHDRPPVAYPEGDDWDIEDDEEDA